MDSLINILENGGCYLIDCDECALYDGLDCALETEVKRLDSKYNVFNSEQFLPTELAYVKNRLVRRTNE